MAIRPDEVHITGKMKMPASDRTVVMYSGYVLLNFHGDSDFVRDTIEFPLIDTRPGSPFGAADVWTDVREQTCMVTLASITNDQTAFNAGWAVDDCQFMRTSSSSTNPLTVRASLAVRDIDGFILRLAFHVTVQGFATFISGVS
jgi:hypothetical protein